MSNDIEGKPFTDVLGEIENGHFLRELTAKVYEVVRATQETRKPGSIKIETWVKNFSAPADTWSSETHQDIQISQEDGGGGPFYIIETQRWAFDSIDEFVALLKEAGVPQTVTDKEGGANEPA